MTTFDIVLKGLQDDRMRLTALQKLQKEFGIDLAVGTLMLATTPTVVKRVMNLDEAEAYYHALNDIGFDIEMRKDASLASPTLVGHHAPEAEKKKRLTRGLTLLLDFDVKQSMRKAIGRALTIAFRGSGPKWLVTCSIVGVLTLGISSVMLSLFSSSFGAALAWIGVLMGALMGGVFVGVLASFLRQCFWGIVSGEKVPQTLGEVGPEYLRNEVGVSGLVYFVSLVLLQVLALSWFFVKFAELGFAGTLVHPVSFALLSFGLLYWPVGLSLAASQTNPGAFWALDRALELLKDAPLPVASISLGGALLTVFSWSLLAMIAGMVGTGAAIGASLLLFGPVLAYVHGAQGALLGIVFKANPDALD